MDKIKNYIENVFASLPKTKEVVEMKLNMLEHMQDKYNALLEEGKNENEAFGLVIADFGSIEEIKAELGLTGTDVKVAAELELENNEEYIAFRKKFNLAMTCGVGLILLGVIVLLILASLFGATSTTSLPVIVFMVFVLVAVVIFVYFGMQNEKYEKFKKNYEYETAEISDKKRLSDAICSIIMMSATVVFLIAGFVYDAWHPAWIVFPVGGIICGMVATLFGVRREHRYY